ncbi:MAG: hypothetical protein R2705_19735 [Ilumatobacteraceae bacterium]
MPYVIPAIALVAGIKVVQPHARWFLDSKMSLIPFYVVLALPFTYRSIDAGLRAIDLRTLVDASRSLGAGWGTTLFRVLLPNLRTAIISASFLIFAIAGRVHDGERAGPHDVAGVHAAVPGSKAQVGPDLALMAMFATIVLFVVVSRGPALGASAAAPPRSPPLPPQETTNDHHRIAASARPSAPPSLLEDSTSRCRPAS